MERSKGIVQNCIQANIIRVLSKRFQTARPDESVIGIHHV